MNDDQHFERCVVDHFMNWELSDRASDVIVLTSPSLLCFSQQGYVLGSHHVSICGQSGRIFTEVCQEGQAEAVAEFVPVPLSGQTHRAHALATAQG